MGVHVPPPEGKYTYYPSAKTKDEGSLHGPADITTEKGDLAYKVSRLANFQNTFSIANIFSTIRALLAKLLGLSWLDASKAARRQFSELTKDVSPSNIAESVRTAMNVLAKGRRALSLTEAQQLRADSALALYNSGFDQLIVEHYANWQTEGSPREGEVWSKAYDRLLSNAYKKGDIDPTIGMLLLEHVGTRYPQEQVAREKLPLEKAVLQSLISSCTSAPSELRGKVTDVTTPSELKALWSTVINQISNEDKAKENVIKNFEVLYPPAR